MSINCYAAKNQSETLTPYSYDPSALGGWDIEVAITHCGICHSDLHLIDNDWGVSSYPLIPGHEIIGTVTAKGEHVEDFAVGERVGIGWQRSSCQQCEWCHKGEENLCAKQEATCVGHAGGFAEKIRADSRFAFSIPEDLPSEQAAPLLCGGATVYSPLATRGVKPTDRVGIVGIGGLGHLAVQFAHAFGCEVTAFSHSPDKEVEAKKLGADHFISSTDKAALEKAAGSLDFILVTISAPLDWEVYLDLLRPYGMLCFVGAQEKPICSSFMKLLEGRKAICASNIASCPDMKDMLRFAAQHGIKAQIELFPMSRVNDAIDKLRAGKIRYRAVLYTGE